MILFCSACSADGGDVVTLGNVDQFKSDLVKNNPVGTKKRQVEDYFDGLKLEYSYIEDEKIFYAIVPNIGTYRFIYTTSLLIRIYLNQNDRLVQIEFEIEHTGI